MQIVDGCKERANYIDFKYISSEINYKRANLNFYKSCLKWRKTKDIMPFWVYTVFVKKTITCKG